MALLYSRLLIAKASQGMAMALHIRALALLSTAQAKLAAAKAKLDAVGLSPGPAARNEAAA